MSREPAVRAEYKRGVISWDGTVTASRRRFSSRSLGSICAGCGGSSSVATPALPPAPDFTLSLSSNSISIAQGAARAVSFSVNPVNGFSGAVQVTLNALPLGVTSNPASPFSVAAGANTAVIFGASAYAPAVNFTVSVQGTSRGLSHGANLAVAIQSGLNPALPRTAYAKTDSVSAAVIRSANRIIATSLTIPRTSMSSSPIAA